MEKRNQAAKLIIGTVIVIIAVLFLAGIVSGHNLLYKGAPLSREDIDYLQAEAPTASGYDGTITAADWNALYPDIVFSMDANSSNDEIVDYLKLDPYLVEIYEGFGFAKEYGSARGHSYTLEDVAHTARPHPLANCLTCKTPNFTKLVQDTGVSAYKLPFDDVLAEIQEKGEAVSCYTCHGNNAGNGGEIVITHTYVEKALGANAAEIDPATLSCGQCHIEYYFTPDEKETMMPYHSVAEMTPEAIYDYYTALGYSDWTQESTGAKMLKAQHPEMETYLLGKHAGSLNCADCHMPVEENTKTQTVFHSHLLVSPLENKTLLETCLRCHTNMKSTDEMVTFVRNIQARIIDEETRVGNLLMKFKQTLAAANQAGTLSEEQLDEVRELYRKAQWFFDFCYVENAEGAHNSDLATRCLYTSEQLIKQGMTLLDAQ